jgi:hypothetical protein
MKTKQENQMEWLQNEIKRDVEDLNRQKLEFIEKIKGINKTDVIPVKKKITIWERIKTVLRIH